MLLITLDSASIPELGWGLIWAAGRVNGAGTQVVVVADAGLEATCG